MAPGWARSRPSGDGSIVRTGVGGVGFGVEAAGVVAGELEAVEKSGGALDVELPGGESVMTTERAT